MRKFLLFVTFLTAWNVSMASTEPVGREVSKNMQLTVGYLQQILSLWVPPRRIALKRLFLQIT